MLINFINFRHMNLKFPSLDLSQRIGLLTERTFWDREIIKHWYVYCIVARKTHTEIEYKYTENSGIYEDIPETPNSF